jgi:hypothetical protein
MGLSKLTDATIEKVMVAVFEQHTSKSLPKVSWRQLENTDAAGKMMLAVFLVTFILLAFLFWVAHLVRA